MDAEQIVAGLTEAANRALLRIGTNWTSEGRKGPSHKDAYSLGWGKAAKFHLIEKLCVGIGPQGSIWEYRLTPLGLKVKIILQEQSK